MRIIIKEAGVEYRIAKNHKVSTPQDAAMHVAEIKNSDVECFAVLCLDTKNGLRIAEVVTKGLLDASLVHPREVFRTAIAKSAASIVLAHNHPSGDVTPSMEDICITRQLVEAGKVVDIKVLDHVIVGPGTDNVHSMREEGMVDF